MLTIFAKRSTARDRLVSKYASGKSYEDYQVTSSNFLNNFHQKIMGFDNWFKLQFYQQQHCNGRDMYITIRTLHGTKYEYFYNINKFTCTKSFLSHTNQSSKLHRISSDSFL